MEQLGTEELDALKEIYAITASSRAEEVEQPVDECLDLLRARLVESKEALVQKSRTAKLWLQYMDHITLVKDFIRAERTSNWQLHLTTVRRMLNLFAAAGHTNYARCGRLYLQLMADHGPGLSESVRILWVKTMHKSAGVFSSLNFFLLLFSSWCLLAFSLYHTWHINNGLLQAVNFVNYKCS